MDFLRVGARDKSEDHETGKHTSGNDRLKKTSSCSVNPKLDFSSAALGDSRLEG